MGCCGKACDTPFLSPLNPSPNPISMKSFATFLAMSLIAAGVASAAPANTVCPVSGKDADASITSKHKGADVAFCCNKCKGKFDADPSKFEGKIKK